MNTAKDNLKSPPGWELAKVLLCLPEADRKGFVALVEQKGKATADLEILREVKAYKEGLSHR